MENVQFGSSLADETERLRRSGVFRVLGPAYMLLIAKQGVCGKIGLNSR